jgi:hypothetical protein
MGAPKFDGDVVLRSRQAPQGTFRGNATLMKKPCRQCSVWVVRGSWLMVNNIRVVTHQSSFQAINQGFLTKGLAQEPDCPGCQRLPTRRLISKA